MVDREASLPLVQIDFLEGLCGDVYESLEQLAPSLAPMVQANADNIQCWGEVEEGLRSPKTGKHLATNRGRNL